ncbi:MAG: hypothetical protein ABI233_10035 [Chthoniobacterales bacterium]
MTEIVKLPRIGDAKDLHRPVGTRFHHAFLVWLRDARDDDHHYNDDNDPKNSGAMASRAAPDRVELLVTNVEVPAAAKFPP